ncbi:N-acetyltransferase family protein [Symmachiella dynata]|mgnify:CR=1 FL=1|uniref:GNAT family N-acetyltransferase n=1 Tax=Symmachiella dynata TaxID=2527995 RepID=UPI0030EDF360
MPVIRPAQQGDLNAINDIYNAAIRDSTATFDTDEKTLAERQQWFDDHGPRYPILVAEVDNDVVGWASLSHWNQKPAYDISAETTFYVAVEHRGQGIGRALKAAIIEEARHHGFHSLIALVTAESEASLHLNKMFGFVEVGVLKEIGRKFDRLLDVVILQKILN